MPGLAFCKQILLLAHPRHFAKMPGDRKLDAADELWDLYIDFDYQCFGHILIISGYKYTQPIVSDSGINNEKFHLELSYEEIK